MKYLESFDKIFWNHYKKGIPNDRFWEFVDKTGWKEYCNKSWNTKYKANKTPYYIDNVFNNIAPYFTFEEFKEFYDVYNLLYEHLDKKLKNEAEAIDGIGFGVSDDGYTDLLSSIIGMGRDFFLKVLNSPDDKSFKIVRGMVKKEKYRENFKYIFTNVFDRYEGETINYNFNKSIWNKIYKSNNFDKNKEEKILSFVNSKALERYWEFTHHTGWYKNSSNFFEFGKKYVLKNIAPHFSHDEFKRFYKIYKQLDKYLQLRLKDVDLYAEGDAYWDLRSTIIGDGKDSYIKAIKGDNNNKFVRRMDGDNDYYENFGYIFSYHDFDITVPEEDCKEEWDRIYNANN